MIAHTARAHATLAPSAAKRWINCAASVRATAGLPDDTSRAAAEGTAAHELASHCLETADDPGTFFEMWVDIKAPDGKSRFVRLDDEPIGESAMRFFQVDEEMVDGVRLYVDYVRDLRPAQYLVEVEIEQRLDMTHLHPEIFGTGDATVYDHKQQHLHVVDFKYGKGVVVEADDNPQLLLYAAGAARRYHNRQIARLTIHIVQPRAQHVAGPTRKFDVDLIELFEFEDRLAAAAKTTDDPNAPFNPGPWCADTFCKLFATCEHARRYALEAAATEFGTVDIETTAAPIEELTPEQEGRILREADFLLARVKAVQERAHAIAMQGKMPDGFKLVAKRANRKWKDEKDAERAMLDHCIEPFQPAKLKSPAMAESGFPGKNSDQRKAAMSDLVVKKSSGFNLVPLDHPGIAVNVGAGADFEAVDAI